MDSNCPDGVITGLGAKPALRGSPRPAQNGNRALKDQAKRAQTAVKAERSRQKFQAAQTTINQLESYSLPKTFRALHKPNNPYSAWIGISTYGSINDALAAVLSKKKQGSIAVQIQYSTKITLYSFY